MRVNIKIMATRTSIVNLVRPCLLDVIDDMMDMVIDAETQYDVWASIHFSSTYLNTEVRESTADWILDATNSGEDASEDIVSCLVQKSTFNTILNLNKTK